MRAGYSDLQSLKWDGDPSAREKERTGAPSDAVPKIKAAAAFWVVSGSNGGSFTAWGELVSTTGRREAALHPPLS